MAKILRLLLALVLSTILLLKPAMATTEENKWSRVNLPAEGDAGNWVLAPGSDVRHLTRAGSSLFAYANPSGTDYTLFQSNDGYHWSATGRVKDAIVAITTPADDPKVVYYATLSNLYKSVDAANSFTLWGREIGGAGSANITITSLTVTRQESHYLVAVGTSDNDSSQYGGVYILDESKPLSGWINTNSGSYDVLAIAFSPNFARDHQLVAVVTDEVNTIVTSRIDDAAWGRTISNAKIEGLAPKAVAIAFPDDYNATNEDSALFLAINAGSEKGDIYRVNLVRTPAGSVATDLNVGSTYNLSNIDISGLAVSGNTTAARLLGGSANSAQVYISTDGGLNWKRSRKPPTGQSKTYLLMAPDFSSSGIAYASTSGNGSAFSHTSDGGATWNQTGLIDSTLSNLVDLAPSPNYSQDNTLFLLTFGGEHSLWRSLNGGEKWQRVSTSTLASADNIRLVELSPQYDSGTQVVFLTGISGGNGAVWKSIDSGQTFSRRSAPSPIDVWTVVSDDTLLLGSYDGSNGLVYRTTDGGFSYSPAAIAGSQALKSIAISPSYEQDTTILIGNANGWVFLSSDNGTSFKPLPPDSISPPLYGAIAVAFDPQFKSNKTVYAASNTADKGIYRFIINKSRRWERIDGSLPSGGTVSQLKVSSEGTLYAINSKANGGMERSLNPASPLEPTFETVTRGLDDGAILTGLWLRGNQLWSIDSQNIRLMTDIDGLTSPITLGSPPNRAPGISRQNITLKWASLKGASEYQWQLDYDADFSTVPSGFEGKTNESSARLAALELGTTYYWRVRATKPALSPWSAKWSFNTSLGASVIAPELLSPKPGASETPVKPVFQWSAIADAESYELLVSRESSFANPIIIKIGDYALPATAWQSDISLDFNSAYYWKVRARGSASFSAWSAVGAFTTLPAPSQPSPSPPAPTSSPPSPPPTYSPPISSPAAPLEPSTAQPILPDWVIPLGLTLLVIAVLLLATLLVVVVRRS